MSDSFNSPINGLSFAPEWAGTNVYLACLTVRDETACLYPEELACLGKAAELRKKTFSSGRQCARNALAEAGLPAVVLPRAEGGAIVWPDGVIGSISHTKDWAVAAVAISAMSDALRMGVDLERIQPLEAGVLNLVATPAEQADLKESGSKRWHATALFSMKESIYKCLRDSFGSFIEFHDVEILELASGRPRIRFINERLREFANPADMELRMAVTPDHVFTLAWLRRRS